MGFSNSEFFPLVPRLCILLCLGPFSVPAISLSIFTLSEDSPLYSKGNPILILINRLLLEAKKNHHCNNIYLKMYHPDAIKITFIFLS